MSFQAYLDAIEKQTGKTPRELIDLARERGYGETTKSADIVIRPNLAAMSGSDFSQRNAAILAGEEAVAKMMPELQRKLAASRAAV